MWAPVGRGRARPDPALVIAGRPANHGRVPRRVWGGRGLAIGGLAFALMTGGVARAQPSATLERFRPAPTPEGAFHLASPRDLGHLGWGASLHLSYANDPLVLEGAGAQVHRVVAHAVRATAQGSLGLWERLVVAVALPVELAQTGDAELGRLGSVEADGSGMGDIVLLARGRLLGDDAAPFALAAQLALSLPTAGDQQLRGDDFLAFHGELVAELRLEHARLGAQIGARVREDVGGELGARADDELTFVAGFAAPLWRGAPGLLELHGQVAGATAVGDLFGEAGTPVEALGGLRLEWALASGRMRLDAAAGAGLSGGVGSPDARAVLGFAYLAEGAAR